VIPDPHPVTDVPSDQRSDGSSWFVHYDGFRILVTEMQDGESMPILYRTQLSPKAKGVLCILRGYGETEAAAIVDILKRINDETVEQYLAEQEVPEIDYATRLEERQGSLIPDRLEMPGDDASGRG